MAAPTDETSTDPTPAPAPKGRNARRHASTDRRIAQAREAEAAVWERRLREELEARDAERDEEIALRDARIAELGALLLNAEDYLRLTHAYPAAGGGHDTLGAGFSCDGCVLAKKLKEARTDV